MFKDIEKNTHMNIEIMEKFSIRINLYSRTKGSSKLKKTISEIKYSLGVGGKQNNDLPPKNVHILTCKTCDC